MLLPRSRPLSISLSVLAVAAMLLAPATALAHKGHGGHGALARDARDAECAAAATTSKTQGRSCRTKGNAWKVFLESGNTVLTHGVDAKTEVAAATGAPGVAASGTMADIACTANGVARTRVIYARASNVADASATNIPAVRSAIYGASKLLDWERKTVDPNGSTRLKVACNGDGSLEVISVVLPTPLSSTNFSTIVSDLENMGFSYPDNHAVYFEGRLPGCSGCAGQGTMYMDDIPGADNYSTWGGLFAISYGYLDASVFLHEIAHNQGAVQESAPHASGYGHCNDGTDIMCYPDGGYTSNYTSTTCANSPFDCGHDDYFSPFPAAGSYLATHWNLALPANPFLVVVSGGGVGATPPPPPAPADTVAPTAPASVTATVKTATSIQLNWTVATDNLGVTGYKVWGKVSGQSSWSFVGTGTANSGSVGGLQTGTSYTFAISAYDAAGNESAKTSSAAVTPRDTTAPAAPGGLKVNSRTASSISLGWNAATDNIGVTAYKVWRRTPSGGWTLLATIPGRTFTNVNLTKKTGYTYAISAGDAAGNWSPKSAWVTGTTM